MIFYERRIADDIYGGVARWRRGFVWFTNSPFRNYKKTIKKWSVKTQKHNRFRNFVLAWSSGPFPEKTMVNNWWNTRNSEKFPGRTIITDKIHQSARRACEICLLHPVEVSIITFTLPATILQIFAVDMCTTLTARQLEWVRVKSETPNMSIHVRLRIWWR